MAKIRMTEEQARRLRQRSLFQNCASGPPIKKPRVQKRKEELPENQNEKIICDFLAIRGWIVERNHVGLFVPYAQFINARTVKKPRVIRIGEKGVADWRAERLVSGGGVGMFQRFDFEVKARGEKPKPDQSEWMSKRRLLGQIVVWFDGYDKGNSPLIPWYFETWGGA